MTLRSRLGLLANGDFAKLFAATTVSQFGQQITTLALPLVAIMTLDVSTFEVGLLSAASSIAFLLVGLPSGAIVDRMRRKPILINMDLGRALALFTIPVAWWFDALTIWQLYAVALVTGVLTVFFDVAYQSYLPHLVGRKNLTEGNSKLEAVHYTAFVTGPAVGGQLIAVLTAPVAILIDAVTMALSVLFVTSIKKKEEKAPPTSDETLWSEIWEGLTFVLKNKMLRAIAVCTSSFNLCFTIYNTVLLVFLARNLSMSSAEIGLVLSAIGAAGLGGAFITTPLAKWIGQGRVLWVAILVGSPFPLIMPFADRGLTLWLATGGIMITTAAATVYNIVQVSYRQSIAPDDMLGRMNASMRFLVWGSLPLGSLLGGILGSFIGVANTMWIAAALLCLTFLPIYLSPLRNLRELPEAETKPESADSDVEVAS